MTRTEHIALCQRYALACDHASMDNALTDIDRRGAILGWADWMAMKQILEEEQALDYESFLASKQQLSGMYGFSPLWMPDFLFDFQRDLVDWACRKGRAAIFADCGLGKTAMQLVWAQNVVQKENLPVLILTPIAVGVQTVQEAKKFGIKCVRSSDGKIPSSASIVVTNYERLHHFDPEHFAGVVCDESSILKSLEGVTRSRVTEFMRTRKYRLLCTATAAPNDYIELGTSSEALGELGSIDMMQRFFKNDQNTVKPMRYTGFGAPRQSPDTHTDKWRFKGHAEVPFWRWVCSWARACRKPSDLGYSDAKFVLPELIERQHLVESNTLADGMLFAIPAVGLIEQRDERRRTITERCEKAAELAVQRDCSLIWCHLNPEGDLIEKLIRGCIQVSGKDSDEEKEEKFSAFTSGQATHMVTKQKIGGWGMNWQHCSHTVSFPSHSFEQYYQGIRRCWRFGQKRPVVSDIVTTEGEQSVLENLQRKSKAADAMFTNLAAQMRNAISIERHKQFTVKEVLPSWL